LQTPIPPHADSHCDLTRVVHSQKLSRFGFKIEITTMKKL